MRTRGDSVCFYVTVFCSVARIAVVNSYIAGSVFDTIASTCYEPESIAQLHLAA